MLLSCSQAAEANNIFSATRLPSLSASGALLTALFAHYLEEIAHGENRKLSTNDMKDQTISLLRTNIQSIHIDICI